ncbi:MAG: hypothetical protein Pg6C_04470 [Treponemataceae bacterium]|nr:MAG: hypothetical protein Pg6C_04470 [Treponemataceae bacterium]
MKKTTFALIGALCAMCCFPQSMPAQSRAALSNLVDEQRAAALLRGEKINLLQYKDPQPVLAPRADIAQTKARELIQDLKPSFFTESLFLYKKPAPRARPWTESERSALYNQALALSSLAGLEYYSASRGEMRVFYETSNAVMESDGKIAVPDPVYAVPPPKLTIYARQKDLSFGDNIYRYDYYAYSDSLILVQENITALSYGIIPAVGKNKLRSMVAAIDADEYILLYVVSAAKAASVPGMTDRVGKSFSNRADAIIKWFSGQAEKAFKAN